MTTKKQITITKDLANKKITITREFAAPLKNVWAAWTDSTLLDQWWAPKPWKAVTKFMDFKEGGHWLYSMNGPEGDQHFARVDFTNIDPFKSFSAIDSFCDADGNRTTDLPNMQWRNRFHETAEGTTVDVEITFAEKADLETIVKMGFEEGFAAALENLDQYLATQVKS